MIPITNQAKDPQLEGLRDQREGDGRIVDLENVHTRDSEQAGDVAWMSKTSSLTEVRNGG
jgi:hypothetical protein